MREQGGRGGKGAFGGMVFKLLRSMGKYVLDLTTEFCQIENVIPCGYFQVKGDNIT